MATDAPPRRTGSASSPPPPRSTGPLPGVNPDKRRSAVKEIIGIPMIPLSVVAAAQSVQNPEAISPFALDIYTVKQYEDPLADAICDIADAYPVLGALLDRIGTTTPFMALIGVAIGLGAQIAENHGKLPDGMRAAVPGLVDRQDLASTIMQDARDRTERMTNDATSTG